MTILRTKCCAGETATEPGVACAPTVTDSTNHPSLGSTRALAIGSNPVTETLAFGCAAQVTFSIGAPGRHKLNIKVQPGGVPWRTYFVVWFDSPTALDPSVIGSISDITWGTRIKVSRAVGWTGSEDDPALLTGIALEQGGVKYFTEPTDVSHAPLFPPNPCCWPRLQANVKDEYCAGSEVDYTIGVHRADSAHRSTAEEAVLSNPYRLVGDWFGTLDVNGVPNDDIRPALDLYDSTPIDRVGMVFCLRSDVVARELDLLMVTAPLCGTISAHGSYKTAGPNDAPAVPGSLIVDEPLNAGVPGSMATAGAIYFNDDGETPLYGGDGGAFSSRDGMVLYETIGGGLGEYLSGVGWIPHTLPSPPPYTETFQLTAEVTWKRINDQDRRYRFDERPGGLPPTDRLHSQECGLMIAPFGKVTLGHQLALFEAGGALTSTGLVRVSQAITDRAGLADTYNLHPRAPYGWPCPCDELPDPGFCDGPPASLTGTYGTNPSTTRYLACNGSAIEDGTRLAMVVKRIPNSQLIAGGCIGDDWVAFRYIVEVWVNGRSLQSAPWLGDVSTLGWTWSTAVVNIGLVAHWGGAWSNLKVWHNP